MKKVIKVSLLLMLSLTTINAEKLVFDLFAQDYELKKDDDCANNRYLVSEDVTMDKNLFLENGAYKNCDGKLGHINMILNNPIDNFVFATDFIIENSIRNSKNEIAETEKTPNNRFVKLIDNKGKVLLIKFTDEKILINEKSYRVKIDYNDTVSMVVSNSKGETTVSINNNEIYTKKDLMGTLKFIDFTIYNSPLYDISYTYYPYDKIKSYRLISND